MIREVNTINPFVVPIFEVILGEFNLEEEIKKRVTPDDFFLDQTDSDLHTDKVFFPLVNDITNFVYHVVCEALQYDSRYKVDITAMWGNIQKPGETLRTHQHHNNILAGVFYLNENDDFPPLRFYKDQLSSFDPIVSKYNIYNQGSYLIKQERNKVVLFPAMLSHGVDVNQSTEDRLSISFNVMLRGRYSRPEMKQSVVF